MGWRVGWRVGICTASVLFKVFSKVLTGRWWFMFWIIFPSLFLSFIDTQTHYKYFWFTLNIVIRGYQTRDTLHSVVLAWWHQLSILMCKKKKLTFVRIKISKAGSIFIKKICLLVSFVFSQMCENRTRIILFLFILSYEYI